MKLLILGLALLLAGCCVEETVKYDGHIAVVILYRGALAKKSEVFRIGPRCWVAWYQGIEKLVLSRDGFIVDGPFKYRWTLDRRGPDDADDDHKWFDTNCIDLPLGAP